MSIEFPLLYDDELLTSGWARYYDHMGYSRLSHVLVDLFGSDHVKQTSDLPRRIGAFAQRLPDGYPCTSEDLLQHHTLFPYYAPFLTSTQFHAVANAMMAVRAARGSRHALAVRPTMWQRMRYCPACVVFDRDHTKGQECYWHRLHQAPGVYICPQHHTWLEESNVPSWGAAAAFVSAERAGLTLEPRAATTSPWHRHLEEISRESAYLLSISGSTHTGETLARNLWSYLRSRSYITSAGTRRGRVRAALLAYDLFHHYSADVLQLLGWNPHEIVSKLRRQLSHLVRHKPFSNEPHLMPLLAILLSCYFKVPVSKLLQEPKGIASTNIATARKHPGVKHWPCVNPLCEQYQKPSESVRLSKPVGAKIGDSGGDYKFLSRLICACGYRWTVTQHSTPKGGPEKITIIERGERWKAELRRLWDDHRYSIRRIAERLHASPTTITAQARKLGLVMPRDERQRKAWPATADFLAQMRAQRTYLQEILRRYPSTKRRDLYRDYNTLYIWFLTWDRSWFDQCLPSRIPFTSAGRTRRTVRDTLATATTANVISSVVSTSRFDTQAPSDEELAQLVRSTASHMVEEGSLLRISWSTLRKLIPELSISPGQLQKLPLTYAALRDVTESGEEVCVRRIFFIARQWIAQGQVITKWRLIEEASATVFYYSNQYKSHRVQRAIQTVLEGQCE